MKILHRMSLNSLGCNYFVFVEDDEAENISKHRNKNQYAILV